MKYVVEVQNGVISFTNEPQEDGYLCGFEVAQSDPTSDGKAAYRFLIDRLDAIEFQVGTEPAKRGELRKKPKVDPAEVLVDLAREPISG